MIYSKGHDAATEVVRNVGGYDVRIVLHFALHPHPTDVTKEYYLSVHRINEGGGN